jgi:WD40 repeat protein
MFASDRIQLNWQRHHSTKQSKSGMLLMYTNLICFSFICCNFSCSAVTNYYQFVQPGYFLRTISGHAAPVMSIDFHPKKTELLCSCDSNNDIRFWDINASCVRAVKGASTQVRFQPRTGQFLAAASENTVSIFDIENNNKRVNIFKVELKMIY